MKLLNGEVRVETTNSCNANCTICTRDSLTRPLVTMTNNRFRKIVTEATKIGAKTITAFGFGEPLLDQGIVDKIAFCSEMGLETFLTTNSSLLTAHMSRGLVGAGLSHMRFSAHGLGNNYEAVHKGLGFSNFMRNTFNFIKESDGLVTISVSAIPMHGESIDEFIDFWKPGDFIDYLEIWKPHNWTSKKDFRGTTAQRKKTCGRPFNGPLQINSDATMMICCFDTNGEMTVGDLTKDSIEDILKGDMFEAIREKHRTGNLKGLPCETCDQLNIGENPLLYSNRDPDRKLNCTSTTKFQLKEREND